MNSQKATKIGRLIQCQQEIEGKPETCVIVEEDPIILRPMPTERVSRFHSEPENGKREENSDFVFRNVNFACLDGGCLFVLQNLVGGLKVKFEDCHFVHKK